MHEVAIMQSTLDLVLEHARRANAARVRVVKLRIGEMSGVCSDALSLAFEVVTQGTIAEGALLETVEEPTAYQCDMCGAEFHPSSLRWDCPDCGSPVVTLLHGRELDLVALAVE